MMSQTNPHAEYYLKAGEIYERALEELQNSIELVMSGGRIWTNCLLRQVVMGEPRG